MNIKTEDQLGPTPKPFHVSGSKNSEEMADMPRSMTTQANTATPYLSQAAIPLIE
jgi:hypothetical protein